MNTIEMSRKDFTKKVLEKIESRLITEGIDIDDDVELEDKVEDTTWTNKSPKGWEKYVREALGQSTYVQKINKEIDYKSIEGKNCNITIREGSEYYDKLEKVSNVKAKNYPELWSDMVALVREIIEKTGKPKMYELIRIRPKGGHTNWRTASTFRVNFIDINAFNIIGFDDFYDGLCRNIIEYPKGKSRSGYVEPVTFVEHTKRGDNTYKGELHVVWNFEPMTYTVYGKYVLRRVYDIDEPDYVFDMDKDAAGEEFIPKIAYPLEESIKRNLNYDNQRISDNLFADAIKSKSIWFDVYINIMDRVKANLKNHGITNIEVLDNTVTAEEIINHVNAETVE